MGAREAGDGPRTSGTATHLRLGFDLRALRPWPVAPRHESRHHRLRPRHGEAAARIHRARVPGRWLALQGAGAGHLRHLCQRPDADEGRQAHRQFAGPRAPQLALPGESPISLSPTQKALSVRRRRGLSLWFTTKTRRSRRKNNSQRFLRDLRVFVVISTSGRGAMSIDRPASAAELEAAIKKSLAEHWRLFLAEGIVLLVLGVAAIIILPLAGLAPSIQPEGVFLCWRVLCPATLF